MGTWCKNNSLRFTPRQAIRHFPFVFLLLPWSYQLIQSGNNSPHCDIISRSVYNSSSPFYRAPPGWVLPCLLPVSWLGDQWHFIMLGIINDICSQPSSVALLHDGVCWKATKVVWARRWKGYCEVIGVVFDSSGNPCIWWASAQRTQTSHLLTQQGVDAIIKTSPLGRILNSSFSVWMLENHHEFACEGTLPEWVGITLRWCCEWRAVCVHMLMHA